MVLTMVEHAPQTKADEQYPLLKVSSGGDAGDAGRQPPPTAVSPGWSVTCTPKRSWLSRWPEIVTACWMTGILLVISFLVMYVLTMGAIRKHSLVIVKCNNSKPGSEVYFHHIIQRGSRQPFVFYSEYLEYMALQYPFLQFNVFFLTDDSLQSNIHRGYRHPKILSRLMQYHSAKDYVTNFEETNSIELRDFQLKHDNVNITVIPLSKYMAQTPLRYKWRTIPVFHLTFYVRIFSVWQTGGIGMDLASFSNKFNNHHYVDRRITAILQQHNEGIKPEEYVKDLNIMTKEEENEFITKFFGLVNHMLNETRSFLNKTFSFSQLAADKVLPSDEILIRTHRNKRSVAEMVTKNNIENSTIGIVPIKLELVNTTKLNATNEVHQTSSVSMLNNNTESINIAKMLGNKIMNADKRTNNSDGKVKFDRTNKEIESQSDNTSDVAKFFLIYNFSPFSDSLGPYTFSEPKPFIDQSIITIDYGNARKHNPGSSNILTIDSDGLFVAASSHLHPFLERLMSVGCQRIAPKFAIQDTFFTQCGGLFNDDIYCNNIFIL